MNKRLLGPFLALLVMVAAAAAATNDCIDATVRLTRTEQGGKIAGSGVCFYSQPDALYVLTNAHVAGQKRGTRVTCEFWRDGHWSGPLQGTVVWASYAGPPRDMAIIRLAREQFGGLGPKVIPLGPPDYAYKSGQPITSAGCPGGAYWPNLFKGHIRRADSAIVSFEPRPARGRSGSALFDEAGEHIIGLIAWQSPNDKPPEGYAISLAELWRGLDGLPPQPSQLVATGWICELGTGQYVRQLVPVPCDPYGCWPDPQPRPDYRRRGEWQGRVPRRFEPWPTYPRDRQQAVPAPTPPNVPFQDTPAPSPRDQKLLRQIQEGINKLQLALAAGEALHSVGTLTTILQVIGAIVASATGVGGIGYVLIQLATRFGAPLLAKRFHVMLSSDKTNPAVEVVQRIAALGVKDANGGMSPKKRPTKKKKGKST